MLKHVGRLKRNQRKVIVAFKTLPDDPTACVVVTTENLSAEDHDTLIRLVESNSGQSADEFADVMARSTLNDGSNMLARFHSTGKMARFSTADIEMTPDPNNSISLDELNELIAKQRGVSVNDLAVKDSTSQKKPAAEANKASTAPVTPAPAPLAASANDVLTDEQIAANYRSQADAMFKEAKRLREEAEALHPTKKPRAKKQSAEASS